MTAHARGREFDIIVFGATGYTGQFVVEKLAVVGVREQLTWAVAGRNKGKLEDCLAEAEKHLALKTNTPNMKLKDTPIILCDAQKDDSLSDMCKRTRLLLNCVGPYTLYGEPVVRACIANGTHHLDVSGELTYLEDMMNKFNNEAEERGLFILSACGFDSVPIEALVQFAEQQFDAGALNDVEAYLQLKPGAAGYRLNYGTLHSLVNSLARGEASKSEKLVKRYERDLPRSQSRLKMRFFLHRRAEMQTWAVPFLGSDRPVVYRTQRTLLQSTQHRPVQVIPYMHAGSFWRTFALAVSMAHLFLMSKCPLTRKLVLKHPKTFTFGYFSKDGSTRQQIEQATFTYTAFARGWSVPPEEAKSRPDRLVRVDLHGHDYGYVTTALCLVEAAVSVLKESDRLVTRGGVLTVGAVLHNTQYLNRLQNSEDGFRFQVVQLKPKQPQKA